MIGKIADWFRRKVDEITLPQWVIGLSVVVSGVGSYWKPVREFLTYTTEIYVVPVVFFVLVLLVYVRRARQAGQSKVENPSFEPIDILTCVWRIDNHSPSSGFCTV